MANSSNYPELLIKVNHTVYNGWLYFILLCVFAIILFISQQKTQPDRILTNAMFSSASITMISFILRAVYIVQKGVVLGLITDHQMWVFPLITIVLGTIIWATKKDIS